MDSVLLVAGAVLAAAAAGVHVYIFVLTSSRRMLRAAAIQGVLPLLAALSVVLSLTV